MAIDKTLLLNMLINSAPLLMQALSKPYGGSNNRANNFFNSTAGEQVQDIYNRGYDMNLIQDDMLSTLKTLSPDNVTDTDAAMYAVEGVANHIDEAADLLSPLNNFPSDMFDDINPSSFTNKNVLLQDIVGHSYKTPALKSAFAMLKNNPNIGK